jgi:O-antigen ligase
MVSAVARRLYSHQPVGAALPVLGAALVSLVAGRAVASGHAAPFAALAVGAVALPILLRHASYPLVAAVGIMLALPSWQTIGRAQLTVERAAVLLVLLALVMRAYRRGLGGRLHVADAAVAALIAYTCVDWALGSRLPNELRLVINYLIPLVFYFGLRAFAQIRWTILWTVLVSTTCASLTVFYEFFVARRPLFVDAEAYRWLADSSRLFRPAGVFGSPPAAGTALAVAVFAGIALLARTGGAARILVWACIALDISGVVVTFTRAPMIGLAAGVVAYLVVVRPRIWPRLVYASVGLALVGALIVIPRIERTSWLQEGVLRKGTLAARQSYWHDSLPFVTNSYRHLWFGHGVNSLFVGRPELPGTPSTDLATDPLLLEIGPHSQYVRTLLEGGIVAFVLLVAWLGGALLSGLRTRTRIDSSALPLIGFGTASLVLFALVATVGDALRIQSSAALVAIAAGMLVPGMRAPCEENRA